MQRYEADNRARGAEDVMAELLEIDGSYGEGGGQILRTSLSLAAITGRHIRIYNLRSKRRTPGLAAQHLTAVRAVAALCQAETRGDELRSQDLEFAPQAPVQSGSYVFDVAQAREGGSAGSVNLVLQAVLLPLALASGESHLLLRGGTHLPLSPPFDYIRDVWIKAHSHFGINASVTLDSWGWFPIGGGQIRATIAGSRIAGEALKPLHLIERGRLRRVAGCAVAANLPAHIPQRMCDRATALLEPLGTEIAIRAERVSAACPGAGLFLVAEYENIACGFSVLGAIGKPSEQVAEEASSQLLAHFEVFLTYKLAAAGGEIRLVDPRNTSRKCSNCQTIDARNRKSQALFQCVACGHKAHADVNAAINILQAGTRPSATSKTVYRQSRQAA